MRLFLFSSVALAAQQPNIVYLVIDDWGWANFAPHRPAGQPGNEEFLTPNLAALASEGVIFDRLYAHKFCGPSRAAIQTGRLPIHVTVLDDNLADHNPKDPISVRVDANHTCAPYNHARPPKKQTPNQTLPPP